MATETLYFSDEGEVSNCTLGGSSVIGSYDSVTRTFGPTDTGDWYGGGGVDDASYTPTGITSVKAIYWNSGGGSLADDTVYFQMYDYEEGWINLQTFNSSAQLPTSEQEFDYTVSVDGEFDAATNKTTFVNSLVLRWYQAQTKGQDDIVISTQGIEVIYEYTPAAGLGIPIASYHYQHNVGSNL